MSARGGSGPHQAVHTYDFIHMGLDAPAIALQMQVWTHLLTHDTAVRVLQSCFHAMPWMRIQQ